MATWALATATENLTEILDKAETEGPQLIERGKRRFVLSAEEKIGTTEPNVQGTNPPKPFVSAWDLLRPPDELLFDFEFERLDWKQREVDL